MGGVLVALDSFKGSLDAATATTALSRGLRRHPSRPVVHEHPVADGGEGTLDALRAAGFTGVAVRVRGPLGSAIDSGFVHKDGVAVVELADASGLSRLPGGRPTPATARAASTYGTGQVISAALDAGHHTVVIGLGGSATTDGGAGLARALGVRPGDRHGGELPFAATSLAECAQIQLSTLHPSLSGPNAARLVAACDVDNPLLGSSGAAAVYGPQKGADASVVAELDHALGKWARALESATGRAVTAAAGAGAAGGAGFALLALGADMRSGIELVLGLTGITERMADVDLVITGEGSLDAQTLHGKAPSGVARAARETGVPIVAAAGRNELSTAELNAAGFTAAYTLTELESDVGRCLRKAEPLLEALGERIADELHSPAPTTTELG